MPRYGLLGRRIESTSSTSSSSSSESEAEAFGEALYLRNKQLLAGVQSPVVVATTTTTTTTTPLSIDEQVKNALDTKYPVKSLTPTPTASPMPPLMPFKAAPSSTLDAPAPMPLDSCTKKMRRKKKKDPLGLSAPVTTTDVLPELTREPLNAAPKGLIPVTSLLPLTAADYIAATPLQNHMVHSHENKKKTEPRVLAPFDKFPVRPTVATKPTEVAFNSARETAEQKSLRLRQFDAPKATPLSAQDRLFFQLDAPVTTSVTTPVFSLDSQRVERLSTQFAFIDRIASPGMQTLVAQGGHVANLACAIHGDGGEGTVGHHLRLNHPDFYNLLEVNQLVDYVVLEGVIVIVPDIESLRKLPLSKDDKIRDALLYHLIKRKEGLTFQDIPVGTVVAYDTLLAGKQVMVQTRADTSAIINGRSLLRSDPGFMYDIYHIRNGILSPDDAVTVQEEEPAKEAEPDQPEGLEEKDNQGAADEKAEPPKDEKAEEPAKEDAVEEVPARSMQMPVHRVDATTTFTNSGLASVVKMMSQPFYKGALLLGSRVDSTCVDRCCGVTIGLSVFDTSRLFTEYQENRMADLARVPSSRFFSLHFPAHADSQTHAAYDPDSQFTEYECNAKNVPEGIKRADLLSGLVALSFNSPHGDGKRHTLALCHLAAAASNAGSNDVFVSRDENLLLRFRGDDLHTISINHAKLQDSGEECELQREHFIELATQKYDDALYLNLLNKEAFDALLMTQVSTKKFRRAIGKAASKVKREAAKVTSATLHEVSDKYLMSAAFKEAAVDGLEGDGAPVTMHLVTYRSNKKEEGDRDEALREYEAMVESERVKVYKPVDAANGMARNFGAKRLVKFVDVRLGQRNKISLDLRKLPEKKTGKVYYVTSGIYLMVFQFDEQDNLTYVWLLRKQDDLARKLMQGRD